MGKKSNHKHEYEYVPLEGNGWFTHEQKCAICGHVHNKVRIEQGGEAMDHARENLGYGFCAVCNRALNKEESKSELCTRCDIPAALGEHFGYGWCTCGTPITEEDENERMGSCPECWKEIKEYEAEEEAKRPKYHAVQFEHNDIPNTSFFLSPLSKEEFKRAWREHKEYLEEAEGYEYKSFDVWAQEQGLDIKYIDDVITHDPYEEGY